MSERWDDPILDDSIPDPVFATETPYKGRVPWGFSNNAEIINGRVAMMGFTVAYLQEAVTGKGVLTLYGLPYDEGAVLGGGGGGIPNFILGPVGLVVAIVLTIALSYGGEYVNNKIVDPAYDGTKLPEIQDEQGGFQVPDLSKLKLPNLPFLPK